MQVVEKTFRVLETLAELARPASLGELTALVNLPKPTVYRLLHALKECGYVEDTEGSGVYVLSGKLERLVRGGHSEELNALAQPHMESLYARFNETVNLGVRERNQVRYVRVLETTQPLRWIVQPGETDCLFTTALGKAILSATPDSERKSLLSRAGSVRNHPTARQVLADELEAVARCGWAVDREDSAEGVVCMAFSLKDFGFPDAAISLAIPAVRCDAELQQRIVNEFQKILRAVPDGRVA